jgi:SAM-dependent methyltransferase
MRCFARRSFEAELMEAPDASAADLAACLDDLAAANTVTRARPPTLAWLARATRALAPGQGFSLLDVGYGQGDMLRAICAWASKAGLQPRLTGVDLIPASAAAAAAATDPLLPIEYVVGDVFDYAPDHPVDYIVSSLVAHHMTDEQLVRFIQLMERTAGKGWFVNDLHRHRLAFYGFKALAALARWRRFVRHDGPISVARAFRRTDWERLLAEAGLPPGAAVIEWRFPFRLCVGRIR